MDSVPRIDPFGIVGTKIGGKYSVEELVEETTFSVVYRAKHLVWERSVAIKAYKAEPALNQEAREAMLQAFVREGKLLTELSEECSAIVQARDLASMTTPDGAWVPYMVLEWVDGEVLEVKLARERGDSVPARTLEEAMQLLKPIAEALAVVHARGIVHCDVKPGNVMLVESEGGGRPRAKLLDFGVAKVLEGAKRSRVGAEGRPFTPAYAAPEQFEGEAKSPATDVFALALMMVELVAGCQALHGEGIAELAASSTNPLMRPTPQTLGVPVSDEVEAVFWRALAVQPGHRFPNARAFWDALEAAAGLFALDANASGPRPSFPSTPSASGPRPSLPSTPSVRRVDLTKTMPMVFSLTHTVPIELMRRRVKRPSVRAALVLLLGASAALALAEIAPWHNAAAQAAVYTGRPAPPAELAAPAPPESAGQGRLHSEGSRDLTDGEGRSCFPASASMDAPR